MFEFLNSEQQDGLRRIAAIAAKHELKIWIVGGIVRDALLQLPVSKADIDLVVDGDGANFAEQVASELGGGVTLFPGFLTAKMLSLKGLNECDVASLRKESYSAPGSLPTVSRGTFEEDSQRRDFSVNALYVPLGVLSTITDEESLRSHVVDVVDGLRDLELRLIRVLHAASFSDDPTRLFRALRYKVKIDGQLETHTSTLFQAAVQGGAMATISSHRVLNEIEQACAELRWREVLIDFGNCKLLESSGMLDGGAEGRLARLLVSNSASLAVARAYQFALAVLYFLSQKEEREARFRRFGFGKKFFSSMDQLRSGQRCDDPMLRQYVQAAFEESGLLLD